MASSSSSNKSIMEKTNQVDQPPPPQHPPLKCPRCDSSNTKFCYYNNYSLSQPRHFCKACKRYWTRGGTLRNVPVGGGCRKNKRIKRQPSNSNGAVTSSDGISSSSTSQQPPQQIDLSPASNHPLFYGMPTNHLDPFSRFRVSSGLDLLPQMNGSGLGIGFSSSGLEVQESNERFKQIQDQMASSSSQLLSDDHMSLNPMTFFGSSSFGSSSSTMASLLASTLQQQKFMWSGLKDVNQASNNVNSFSGLLAYDQDMQMNGGNGAMVKEVVKSEGENTRLENYNWNGQNQFHEPINTTTPDSSSLLWNTNNIGAWLDPSNMGSSVPSLI